MSTTAMAEPAVAIRSSLQDARSSLQIGYDTECEQPEKQDRETEKLATTNTGGMRRQASVENVAATNRQAAFEDPSVAPAKKTATFAALPNTTTWQQQSVHTQKHDPAGECWRK